MASQSRRKRESSLPCKPQILHHKHFYYYDSQNNSVIDIILIFLHKIYLCYLKFSKKETTCYSRLFVVKGKKMKPNDSPVNMERWFVDYLMTLTFSKVLLMLNYIIVNTLYELVWPI